MKTMQELRDDLNHKVRSLDDLRQKVEKENRAMGAEEKSTTELLMSEIDALKKQIADLEDHERRMASIDEVVKSLKEPEKRQTAPEQPARKTGETHVEIPPYQARYGKLKAFKTERDAYIAGQWYRASILGHYSAQRWCTENGVAYRAQSEGTNSAGGYLVPDQFSQAIIDLRETYGVFRRECDVMPMGSDVLVIPRRAGGLTAYFTAEGTAITDSSATWNNVSLTAKKLGVLTYMSTELAEDAVINIADYLANEMAYAFAYKEDLCGFNGDGSATYGGITGITVKALEAAYAGSKVAAPGAGHDTFAELDATDIATLMSKLPVYARTGAKFFCSQVAYDLVFSRLAIGAGGNTIQTVQGAYSPSYLGHPIVVSQVLPSATTALSGAWMLGFGNLRQTATLGERRGVQIRRSDEIKFVEDQIALKGTTRIDINVHDLGSASAAGPFVSLVGA